jgi:ribosomal protein S8
VNFEDGRLIKIKPGFIADQVQSSAKWRISINLKIFTKTNKVLNEISKISKLENSKFNIILTNSQEISKFT